MKVNNIVHILSEKFIIFPKSFKELIASRDIRITKLENEVLNLTGRSYERRDTIIVSGNDNPLFERGESFVQLACEIFNDELQIVVSPSDGFQINYVGIYVCLSSSPTYFTIFSCPISHITLRA